MATKLTVSFMNGCKICGRVKWGEWVPLPFGKWRHTECAIGSDSYKEWYQAQSVAEQAAIGPFFDFQYPQGGNDDTEETT